MSTAVASAGTEGSAETSGTGAAGAGGAGSYRSLLAMLMPRGKAWNQEPGSVVQRLLYGLALTFARVQERAAALLLEMDPRTADETIADWERLTQPYGNADTPADLAQRQGAVTAAFIARGNWAGDPSVSILVQLAAAMGYAVTIRRFHRRPFNVNSRCTDNLNTMVAGWLFVWEFIAVSQGATYNALLADRILKYVGAHVAATFAFPLLDPAAGTFARASAAVLHRPYRGAATALASGERGELYQGV